ncbi:MAG TPA: hypothetical protein VFV41_01870 [Streptosporangiaceae bacterium]|nr:hypothetical protein [Streptosporangiaceae bacterium]
MSVVPRRERTGHVPDRSCLAGPGEYAFGFGDHVLPLLVSFTCAAPAEEHGGCAEDRDATVSAACRPPRPFNVRDLPGGGHRRPGSGRAAPGPAVEDLAQPLFGVDLAAGQPLVRDAPRAAGLLFGLRGYLAQWDAAIEAAS